MEKEFEREGKESPGNNDSVVDSIKKICVHNARADLSDEKQLLFFLQSWWSRTYNRPLKDPLLLSYTIEELLYEFYDRIERRKAEEERSNLEDDKIEGDKEKAVLDWAEQEEKKELESIKTEAAQQPEALTQDPTKDPENVAWMDEQMRQAKEMYGENFGDDIEEEFKE